VYIICTKNKGTIIECALVIRLQNFVFQFPVAEGGVAKI